MRALRTALAAAAAAAVAVGCGATSKRRDPPILAPWHRIGDISLGEPRARVEAEYGKEGALSTYRLHRTRVYVEFEDGVVNGIGFRTPYYRTKTGFGVGSRIPEGGHWHGFVWNGWVREKPCSCWVKVGNGAQSLAVSTENFLKPWTFINVRHGRVTSFYFALKFVD